MSRTEYWIQQGQVIKTNSDVQDKFGLFSLNKFFKNMLRRYNVAFYDSCCQPYGANTPDADTTSTPVFYNPTTNHLYYISLTTGLPVQITGF